jgi:hypothetical protein
MGPDKALDPDVDDRPTHPMATSTILVAAVTALIVLLAMGSTLR